MPLWNEYHLPTSVDEAVTLLARYNGKARVVAGGTDLILDLQQGNEHPVEALVDVTRITGLNVIRENAGTITIGCGVTHNQIVGSTLLAPARDVPGGSRVRGGRAASAERRHVGRQRLARLARRRWDNGPQRARCRSRSRLSHRPPLDAIQFAVLGAGQVGHRQYARSADGDSLQGYR